MYRSFLLHLITFIAVSVAAQEQTGRLGIEVDGLAFFRDNEYDSDVQSGYSLPGAWLKPKLTYNPTANIHLELGAHGLFFHGANKYPSYVYHDIGTWKGNQYQSGAHLLPWLRAQATIDSTTFVLGDIYGDVNHGFITPLYNKEHLFSSDPEAGFQILSHGNWGSVDAFLNWQSYQFKEDTHQEAFTVGAVADFVPFRISHSSFHIKLQTLLQHRGGEQDKAECDNGVQTICNGSLGIGTEISQPLSFIDKLEAEADILGCYQQAGKLWPFSSGLALHGMAKATAWKDATLQIGCLGAPKNFVSLYGNPFFSTLSLKTPGVYYSSLVTAYADLGYSHTWAEAYTFGANLETFLVCPGGSKSSFTFAAAVYFRFTPRFKIL